MPTPDLRRAAQLLAAARSVCVSTGAGMSAESGVETFRDADGLWSKFNPEEYATPQAFRRDPEKVWSWYRARRRQLAAVEPHAGHRALAAWESRVPQFTIVTQNVDGLHHRAGSQNIIELHGRLDLVRCVRCIYKETGLDDLGPNPLCPFCHDHVRPGVVWFGEMLPQEPFDGAIHAAQHCDIFMIIGTSGVVMPAASLADTARALGAALIEINPNPTPYSDECAVCVRAGCRDALAAIDAEWTRLRALSGGGGGATD